MSDYDINNDYNSDHNIEDILENNHSHDTSNDNDNTDEEHYYTKNINENNNNDNNINENNNNENNNNENNNNNNENNINENNNNIEKINDNIGDDKSDADKNSINKSLIGMYEIIIGLCAKIKTAENVPLNAHFDLSLEQNLFKIYNKDSYTIPLNIKIRKHNIENTGISSVTPHLTDSHQVHGQENETKLTAKCGCKRKKQNNLPWQDIIVPDRANEQYLINKNPPYKSIAPQYGPQLINLPDGESIVTNVPPVKRTPKHYDLEPLATPIMSTTNPDHNRDSISENTAFLAKIMPYETGNHYKTSESNYIDPQMPQNYVPQSGSRNTSLHTPRRKEQVTKQISYIENENQMPEPKSFRCSKINQCKKNELSVSQYKYPSKRAENTVKQAMQTYEKQMEPMQQILNEANKKLRNVKNNCKCRRPKSPANLDTRMHSANCRMAQKSPQDMKSTNNNALKTGTTFNWSDGNVKCPYIRKIVAEEGIIGSFDVVYTENTNLDEPTIQSKDHKRPKINILSRTVELDKLSSNDEETSDTGGVQTALTMDVHDTTRTSVTSVSKSE